MVNNEWVGNILYCETVNQNRRHIYRVGQNKLDCFSELITLRRLVVERRVVCQKFPNCPEKSVKLTCQ